MKESMHFAIATRHKGVESGLTPVWVFRRHSQLSHVYWQTEKGEELTGIYRHMHAHAYIYPNTIYELYNIYFSKVGRQTSFRITSFLNET